MTNKSTGFQAPATSRKPWTTEGSARPDKHSPSPKMKPAIKPASISVIVSPLQITCRITNTVTTATVMNVTVATTERGDSLASPQMP
jgi:hypothetical protein